MQADGGGGTVWSRLDPERRAALLRASVVLELAPATAVVSEGEPGHSMFLLEAGEVEVRVRGPGGTAVTLARLGPGATFGEQALLAEDAGVRSASVVVLGAPARLREVPREAFLSALDGDAGARAALTAQGARQLQERLVRSLAALGSVDLGSGDGTTEHHFAPEEVVFAEGDPGDAAWFVLEGRARVSVTRDGKPHRVAVITSGQCFGEGAVLRGGGRSATVTAEGPLRALRVEATAFRERHAADPDLRDLVATLALVQRIRDDGWLAVHRGTWLGRPTITSIRYRRNGTRVVATKVVNAPIFSVTRTGAAAERELAFERPGVRRTLRVEGTRLTSVAAEGVWPGLGEACRRVMEGDGVDAAALARFEQTGELEAHPPHPDVACACLRLRRAELLRAVADGHHTVAALGVATGAGNVCGACVPALYELVGTTGHHVVRVDAVEPVAPDVVRLRLSPVASPLPAAIPGQYVLVSGHLPAGWVARAYTLADTASAELLVKREPGGLFSRWLCDRAPGDLLRTSDPLGEFRCPDGDVVFFAAGVGITPALAMARAGHRFRLVWSASTPAHFAGRDALPAGLDVTFRTTSTDGRLGRDEVAAVAAAHPEATFLICGPGGFLAEVRAGLDRAGVAPSRVRVEAFTPVGEAPVTEVRDVPRATPGRQGWPLLGPILAGLATMNAPLEQVLACRATAGEVFSVRLPGQPVATWILGTGGYTFMNDLPAETAGIGEVLSLVSVFGRWTRRSDPSPAWLEALALAGRGYVQQHLLRPEQVAAMPATAEALVDERTARWEGEVDLAQALPPLLHELCLRTVVGEPTWRRLGPSVLPLLGRMVRGVDAPKLAIGGTPLQVVLDDWWATRALEALLVRELVVGGIPLADHLRAVLEVGGAPLTESDLVWAMVYVLFNACAYPGTYGFWSFVDLVVDDASRAAVAAGERRAAEEGLLETLRLHPVCVAARMLREDVRYVDRRGPRPTAYDIPAGHLLFSAPGSFTRDPEVHAEPDRWCPHRYRRGEPVPELFGGGAFGCVAQAFTRSVLPAIHTRLLGTFDVRLLDPVPPRLGRPALHYPHRPVRAQLARRARPST